MRLLFLFLLVLGGCTRRAESAPEVREAPGPQHQAAAAPPRSVYAPAQAQRDSGCAPVAAEMLCSQQGRQCGRLLVTDSCGAAQQLSCGDCAQGQHCTPRGRCEEACPAGQQRCCDGQCAAPSDCEVLVCDPVPAPVEQPSR